MNYSIGDLGSWVAKVKQRENDIFVGSTLEVQRSVVEGSEITGAPGQPIDLGNLRSSWIPEFTEPRVWQTTTKVDYAPHVEANVRGVTFRNHGPHSVAMTKAGWPRIAEAVVDRVVGS